MEILGLGAVAFLAFFVLSTILGSFFTVNTAQVAVITRFGKFLRVAEPGLNWKVPFIDSVSGRISLRVNQITLTMETKTKDNVFVTIPISVQNRVRPEKAFDAYYKLSDPAQQIKSYVEQVILGHVPGMTLDEVFASQSGIAAAVKKELDVDMAGFGDAKKLSKPGDDRDLGGVDRKEAAQNRRERKESQKRHSPQAEDLHFVLQSLFAGSPQRVWFIQRGSTARSPQSALSLGPV